MRAIAALPRLSAAREAEVVAQMLQAEDELRQALASAPALAVALGLGSSRPGRAELALAAGAPGRSRPRGAQAVERASRGALAAQQRLATAFTELLRAHLRLVVAIARRHANRGLELADLIQEGNIGLMRAIERYDPRRNVRFSTHAGWWIRQSIGRALADQGGTIRIPTHVTRSVHEMASTTQDLVRRLGRMPAEREIAQRMAVPVEQVRRMLSLPRVALPIDAGPGPGDGFGQRFLEVVGPAQAAIAEETAETVGARRLTRDALAALDPQEREVISLRFGIDEGGPLSLRALARHYRASRDWVRRIEQRALRKLSYNRDLRGLVDEPSA